MIQPAIVEKVQSRNLVFVRYPKPKGAKSETSRSFWNVKERAFPAENPKELNLKKGDVVELMVEPAGAIKAAFLVFMVPLLGFFLFYKGAEMYIQSMEVLFLAGLTGLMTGIGINLVLYKLKGPGKLPRIQKILQKKELFEFLKCNSACKNCGGCS